LFGGMQTGCVSACVGRANGVLVTDQHYKPWLCSNVTAAALSGNMIALTDSQLAAVMDAARTLPVERRDTFLQRVGAMLRMRGRFTDDDVADVTTLALTGLAQQPAA
jgi:hypothetical protein